MADLNDILKEVSYKTARSSGAGGQHVNKVETAVKIIWNLEESKLFSLAEKERIRLKLKSKIDKSGNLLVEASNTRSQNRNKEAAQKKLLHLVRQALKMKKRRIATKKSRNQDEKRLKVKRIKSEHKQNRKKPEW